MRRIVLTMTLAALSFAGASAPRTTPLFRMDCGPDGAKFPACGFDFPYGKHEGRFFTRTRVPAGSPSGSDSVRFNFIPTDTSGQFDYVWFMAPDEPVPQGATRYIRYRVKVVPPVKWESNTRKTPGGKLVILGNLCEREPFGPTRVIGNFEPDRGREGLMWLSEQGIAGPPSRLVTQKSTSGDWHHVQIKIVSSSTASARDGMLYQYIDRDNRDEKKPTAKSSGGFNLRTIGWSTAEGCRDSQIVFGGTTGGTLSKDGHAVFELADFEYDDEFDPSWHLPTKQ